MDMLKAQKRVLLYTKHEQCKLHSTSLYATSQILLTVLERGEVCENR